MLGAVVHRNLREICQNNLATFLLGNGPRRSPGSSIKKAIARAGLGPEVAPHVFRHSVATKLLNGGMPITQVQYFLGHKDPMTTHRYLHTSKQASSVAAAAILSGT